MEEIEYKLKSKNIILITEAIDRLIEMILTNQSTELEDTNYPLTYLKEKCASENSAISLTAGRGFLNLIARGYLEISPAMSVAMSMLPSAKNYSAITSIISGILGLIVEQQIALNKGEDYTCSWSLTSPLHPLVLVLNQHPLAIDDILSQVESLCLYNQRISTHSVELMRPVFLWVLCDPNESHSPEIYHKVINILRGLEDSPEHIYLVLECLIWQQANHPSRRVNYLCRYLLNMAITKKNDDLVNALLIVMADLSVDAIHCGEDPRPYFTQIQSSTSYPGVEVCSDILLAILSEAVLICPAVYSLELISLCVNIQKYTGSSVSSFIFASSLLQWLYYPTALSSDFNDIAKNVVDNIFKQSNKNTSKSTKNTIRNPLKLMKNKIIRYLLKRTRSRIFNYIELIVNYEDVILRKDLFNFWMDKIKCGTNLETKYHFVPFLCGILLKRFPSVDCFVDKVKICHIMQSLCEEKKELATHVLPVVLACLRQTKNPNEMVALLQTVVHLAVTKENVPLIVQVLESFKNEKLFPKSFLIALHVTLVRKQTRCYPYLQEFLLDSSGGCGGDAEWEVLTAKAAAVKFICQERSANFGAEMVPVISGLFNRCSDTNSSVAYCFALEALRGLWDTRVVAPVSTWRALAPKIGKDKRVAVQIGVCKLLGEIPSMQIKAPEYESLVSSTITKLWSYVVDSHHPDVTIAAFNALGNYKLENMTLQQIPEIYRKGIRLPPEFCKTPSDAARKPEDVLNYIPGECWANLFMYTNQAALDGVSNFCYKQINREVNQYRSGIYTQTDGEGSKGEPQTVNFLPAASIVRGLMNFVKKEAVSPSYSCPEANFVECLGCLSRKLPRPLPPMLWNFLPELWARGSYYKAMILPLAAQQSTISYTCTRFLQNYLPCLDVCNEKEEELCMFIENLPLLCVTIQPDFIRDTLFKTYSYALATPNTNIDDKNLNFFNIVAKAMKECLRNDDVLESNKIMISDIIEQSYEQFDIDHHLWSDFADLCCELSLEYIERLTAPSSWWEVTSEALRKAISIRTLLALNSSNETGLVWLNEVIDASIMMPREHSFMLHRLYDVMIKNTIGFQEWLLQLMARTQVHMVESSASCLSVVFLCDVIILSVLIYSNYHIYTWMDGETFTISKDTKMSLFPLALQSIFSLNGNTKLIDNCGQILECLHHARNNKLIPDQYKYCFYLALVSCRSSSYIKRQSVWTKYVSSKPHLIIE